MWCWCYHMWWEATNNYTITQRTRKLWKLWPNNNFLRHGYTEQYFAMSIKNNFINDSDEERTKYQTFRFGKNEKQLPLRKNCQLMAKVLNIYKFNKVSLKIFRLFCWHQKNRLLSKKSWKHLFLYLNIYLSIFLSVSLYIIYINLFCWTIPSILIMLHAFPHSESWPLFLLPTLSQ